MSQYSGQAAMKTPDILVTQNQDHLIHAEIWNSEVKQSD